MPPVSPPLLAAAYEDTHVMGQSTEPSCRGAGRSCGRLRRNANRSRCVLVISPPRGSRLSWSCSLIGIFSDGAHIYTIGRGRSFVTGAHP